MSDQTIINIHNKMASTYIEGRIREAVLDRYERLVLGEHQLPVIHLALHRQGPMDSSPVMDIVNFPGNTLSCFHGVRAWDECPTCEAMAAEQGRVNFTSRDYTNHLFDGMGDICL